MNQQLLDKIESIKGKENINSNEIHDIFYILKDMHNADNHLFNESFKLFVNFLKETNYDKSIYAEFLFIMFYYKDGFNKQNNYKEYKELFLKKGDLKANEFLDLDKYENNSLVYCYHDGVPILQALKVNEDTYDIMYDMGKNNEKKHYYYKTTVNKDLLDKFNNNEISLKEILLLENINTVRCIQEIKYNYYTIIEKDVKEIKEEISDELFVSLFKDIWGDVDNWEGIVLY